MRIALFTATFVAVAACGGDPAEVDAIAQPIIDGIPTTARPEIGMFRRGGGMCTATLISPFYAITSARCLNESNYQDTAVRPGDVFQMDSQQPVPIDRIYSFGSHFTEKIWNGRSSNIAVLRLARSVPFTTATPVALSDRFPSGSPVDSTRFGYGCNRRDGSGGGVKRYGGLFGLVSNRWCSGDTGGPALFGLGVDAQPLWGILSGQSWDLSAGGDFDLDADASYHKKQIEAVMRSWDGSVELGIERPGVAYRQITPSEPWSCQAACAADIRCRSWTNREAICSLKDAVAPWSPRAGAASGVSPNIPETPEINYDRPGTPFHTFAFAGADTVCRDTCSQDHRCQVYVVEDRAFNFPLCHLKSDATAPVGKLGFRSAPKRGMAFNQQRTGATLFHTFAYSTPSPEICQSECAKRSLCRSWNYRGPANGRAPQCWLYSTTGTTTVSSGMVSGLNGRIYR